MEKATLDVLKGLSLEELAKAVKEMHGLSGTQHLHELWQDLHGIPKGDGTEIAVGPVMHSSGGGAETAVKEFSNPAPQRGITKEYEEFYGILDHFGTTAKSLTESMKALSEALTATSTKIVESKATVKSDSVPELDKAWDDLAELASAVIKAESEGMDIRHLDEAKADIESAEKHLDKVKEHEKEEDTKKSLAAAYVNMQKGWTILSKASVLSRFGLTGHGNQSDSAVPDDATDGGDGGVEGVEPGGSVKSAAKSRFVAAKNAPVEPKYCAKIDDEEHAEKMCSASAHISAAIKGLVNPVSLSAHKAAYEAIKAYASLMKAEDHEDAKKHKMEHKEEAKSEGKEEAKSDGVVKIAGDIESLRTQNVALKNELDALKGQISNVTRMPAITPVIIKGGANAKNILDKMESSLVTAVKSGEISESNGMTIGQIIQHCRQAQSGHLPETLVNQEIANAPHEVKTFMDNFATANS